VQSLLQSMYLPHILAQDFLTFLGTNITETLHWLRLE
jgi:hypothetical protein